MMRPIEIIFRKEWKEILRDRRAVFTAILLPVIIYPVLLFLFGSLTEHQVEKLAGERLRIGLHDPGDLLGPRILEDSTLVVASATADSSDVIEGRIEALLVMPDTLVPGMQGRATLLYYGAREASREAYDRLLEHIRALTRERRQRRYAAAGGVGRLDSLVVSRALDVATRREAGGAKLAGLLPFLLVVILLTGSSFAALDLIPGEKERGTLETLFLSPIPTSEIAWGKILVVVTVGILAGTLNLLGMILSSRLGLVDRLGGDVEFALSPGSILAILVLIVPLAVLVSGILMTAVAYARSYREASTYVTPVMLLLFLPLMLASGPGIELDLLLALVPIANVALAFREALVGTFQIPFLAVTFLSTALYAAVAVAAVAALLQKEAVVLAHESRPLLRPLGRGDGRTVPARTTLIFAALMILLVYYVGQLVQGRDPYLGLALTLWVLILAPALAYARWASGSLRGGLGLRRPRAGALSGALLLALPLTLLVQAYVGLQNRVLPLPESLLEEMESIFGARDLSLWAKIALFSLSPAVCEELLFRGAIQQALARMMSRRAVILVVAAAFGAVHLSIYRFVPTAILGGILAWIVFRSGSILPAMLLHAAYNALALFGEDWAGGPLTSAWGAWGLGLLSALVGLWLLRRRDGEAGASAGGGGPGP